MPSKAIPPPNADGASHGAGMVLIFLALLLVPLLVLVAIKWFSLVGDADVLARQPIGSVLRMSGTGGFSERMVIETQEGFYPVLGLASISRGTPLTLEVRRSARRYVCGPSRALCLGTTRDHFSAASQGAQP